MRLYLVPLLIGGIFFGSLFLGDSKNSRKPGSPLEGRWLISGISFCADKDAPNMIIRGANWYAKKYNSKTLDHFVKDASIQYVSEESALLIRKKINWSALGGKKNKKFKSAIFKFRDAGSKIVLKAVAADEKPIIFLNLANIKNKDANRLADWTLYYCGTEE